MVFYALLACLDPEQSCLKVTKNLLFSSKMACFGHFGEKRLDPVQCRRKVAKNLLFSAKMACFLAIFDENSKFFVTLRRLCVGSRRARRA